METKKDRPAVLYPLFFFKNRMASGPVRKTRQTEDEALAAFESIPLFMKDLPEDDIQNPTLSALQSLIYEGTPDGGSDISLIHVI